MGKPDYICKLIAVGTNSVGKTSILKSFTKEDGFKYSEVATIGVDLHTTDIKISDNTFRLNFWDTAGQEQFRAIIRNFYRGCSGALLVYDITSWQSFEQLPFWINEIKKGDPHMPLLILGNKLDLEKERAVSKEKAMKFAEQNNISYYEVSAKNYNSILPAIEELVTAIYTCYKKDPDMLLGIRPFERGNITILKKEKKGPQSNCCVIA